MRPLHVFLAGLALCTAPGATSAQQAGFGPLQDSLAAISDVPLLFRMERAVEPPGAARQLEPVVRRGLIALRIWELTGDRADADRSRDVFRTAAERFPAETWGHYGLALALARGPEVRLSVPGGVLNSVTVGQSFAEIFGRDPKSRARRSLRRALELDPSFGEAAVLLSELAVADGGRSRELIEEARGALRAVHAAGGTTARSTRALADMEIALGNYAAAGELSSDAADAGVLRTRAIALMLQPGSERAGAAAYWQGIELLTEETARQYYRDVEVLLTPAEEADWRAADLEGRRMWFDRFWETRAATGGVTATERIAEHYRRLTAARSRYVRNSVRGTDSQGVLLAGEALQRFPFDDRGVVLIRHGEPRSVIRTTHRGVLPNESWYYELPDHGGQLFHFVASRGTQNFSLVRDLLEAMDPTPGLDTDPRAGAILSLVGDRAPYEPRYRAVFGRLNRLLAQAPGISLDGTEMRNLLEVADAEYRSGARAAIRTDSYVRSYTDDLPFHHDVFTFRTPEARTDLTAAFAIPAGLLEPRTVEGGVEYAIQFSVIVTDTLFDVVTRRDSVMHFRFATEPAPETLVRTNLTMAAQPSDDAVYRLVAADSGSGRGQLVTGTSTVRDYTDTGVMVSDIVLAHPDSVGDWRRGGETFALALPREFARDRPFTIYYELYNLTPDRTFSTRITVEPMERGGVLGALRGIFGGGRRAVDVGFDDVATPDADGVMPQTRELASDLAQGSYRIVVTVTTADGQTASTSSEFTVER
ncbi:MAG TPA: GWxTD domain-containing protein [Longimicrobiales bacterium]|nr:GWxTD domain-containing protein [Longimicrobiales bacterium]